MNAPQFASSSARDDLRTEPILVRFVIIAMAVIFLTVFVVLPLVVVFAQAFSKGVGAYFTALSDPEALSAIRLTLMVAVISVGLNLVFGLVAVPGIALATIFVTFPFVARALIPLMQEQGTQEEEAAISLGASGLQTFFRVTLPNIKWGLLYGVLLCN